MVSIFFLTEYIRCPNIYIHFIYIKPKNHDMKNSFKNIVLEGTRSGDVVGGLYREPRENLQALLFGEGSFKPKAIK